MRHCEGVFDRGNLPTFSGSSILFLMISFCFAFFPSCNEKPVETVKSHPVEEFNSLDNKLESSSHVLNNKQKELEGNLNSEELILEYSGVNRIIDSTINKLNNERNNLITSGKEKDYLVPDWQKFGWIKEDFRKIFSRIEISSEKYSIELKKFENILILPEEIDGEEWTSAMFEKAPLVAITALLTSLENDLQNIRCMYLESLIEFQNEN